MGSWTTGRHVPTERERELQRAFERFADDSREPSRFVEGLKCVCAAGFAILTGVLTGAYFAGVLGP